MRCVLDVVALYKCPICMYVCKFTSLPDEACEHFDKDCEKTAPTCHGEPR